MKSNTTLFVAFALAMPLGSQVRNVSVGGNPDPEVLVASRLPDGRYFRSHGLVVREGWIICPMPLQTDEQPFIAVNGILGDLVWRDRAREVWVVRAEGVGKGFSPIALGAHSPQVGEFVKVKPTYGELPQSKVSWASPDLWIMETVDSRLLPGVAVYGSTKSGLGEFKGMLLGPNSITLQTPQGMGQIYVLKNGKAISTSAIAQILKAAGVGRYPVRSQ